MYWNKAEMKHKRLPYYRKMVKKKEKYTTYIFPFSGITIIFLFPPLKLVNSILRAFIAKYITQRVFDN